jgi:DNA-binding XRE family transcriptional regulator
MSGKRLWFAEARIKKEYTQESLAQAAGVTLGAIAKIEAGKLNPGRELMFKLSEKLDIDIKLFQE